MIIFDWIMNINIYHHNNITAKSWVLANISAKNFWNTKTKALIINNCAAQSERIKHMASSQLPFLEKSSNPVRDGFFIMYPASHKP